MTTKALVLARGLGTRMRADAGTANSALEADQRRAADAGLKGMINTGGRPFLDYLLSALADAGIRDVCLVIGPEHHAVRDYFSLGQARVSVRFAEQAAPRGTADAVAAGEDFAGSDTFLVLNADNYYPIPAIRSLVELNGPGLIGFEPQALVAQSNIPAERVRHFALIETDAQGYLTGIHEKPDDATLQRVGMAAPVSMNLWSFTPAIFGACRVVRPSPRGELELQDAVRLAITQLGQRFRVIPFAGGVLDLSVREDIVAVSAALRSLQSPAASD
jgi:glucose-1-phosphate thymidylyltransferase